ncbi:glutamate receptor 2.7-like [Argentina anserina]|uniref:glutamate receptor 2.7-like n=1 Tax=Argentina anserina TaxID=57926 RepID=UPI002176327E|nr:glutamate receptor 2.7-like [Potentilla anserina]
MSSPSAKLYKVKTIWFLSSLLISLFIILSNGVAAQNDVRVTNVGAIIDLNSRIGIEQKAAMEIAAESFNKKSNTHELIIHFRNSSSEPFLAASAAEELMKEEKVQVIVGMEYWPEAVLVADHVKNQSQVVPVISFGAPLITPPLIQKRWPFLIRMTSDGSGLMKCIADIVAAYSWRRVVVIYEDDGYGGYVGLLGLLSEALQDANAKIEQHLVLPKFSSLSNPNWDELEELLKLPTFQSRVFIVLQASLPTVNNLFRVAKKMGLVGRDSAWILTECITSLLDPQGDNNMEGALGISTYYTHKSSSYDEFQREFQTKYEDGNSSKPGIYTLRAYDTIGVISQAIEKMPNNATSTSLQKMIESLLSTYKGLSGTMHLKGGETQLDSPKFKILNVVGGKMNTELNFWTPNFGFSEGIGVNRTDGVGKVIWPGNLTRTPKGWAMPSVDKPMKIGVPGNTSFSKFVKVEYKDNPDENTYDGFCIQIFDKVLSRLGYPLPYEFHAHTGTYDELVEKVHNKTYDAVVGDITVLADRMDLVEFTQPYMGSGLSMIVPEVTDEEAAWMFMKPFTWQMWVVTGSILIYTMLIVWFLEHPTNPEFKGPLKDQVGTAVWFTFSSLFFAHREKVYSNLTRVVFVVWLFVVLILTSSYTANLSSMLTIQRLQPNVTDIQMLKDTNAPIGLDGDSFVYKYMVDVIGFKSSNLINVSTEYNYTGNFKNKTISAAYLELPYADVFMNKYCQGYTATTPTFRFGGLSFIFQKGSPITRDFTKAILELLENGEIKKLQNEWLTPEEECSGNSTSNQPRSLKLNSFSGLYVISGATSTFCFLLSLAIWMRRFQLHETNEGSASPSDETIWNKTVRIVKLFKLRDLEVPNRAPTFASYVVDCTPRWGEYSPTANNPEQPPAFTPAEIECMPVEQAEARV